MNKGLKVALILSTALGACAPMQIDQVGQIHAQRIEPSNTNIGEACDGHYSLGGMRVTGSSLYYLDVKLYDLKGGVETPYASVAAPADKGVSRLTHTFFSRRYQTAACSGLSLETTVRGEDEGNWLDWTMEVALPPESGGARLPADPYRVRNSLRVANGRGTQRVGFRIDNHDFIAYLSVSPGSRWWNDYHHEQSMRMLPETHQLWAKPLPDEKPGRTLRDVTNPGFLGKSD